MSNVHIGQLLKQVERPVVSIEFFPPKDLKGFAFLGSSVERMRVIRADFVTVTYGAGGAGRDRSWAVCEVLDRMGFGPVMPHLTCVGSSVAELEGIVDDLAARGYHNIMALRGDPPKGEAAFVPAADGLRNAAELVALIKARHPACCCGVAGYPEGHPESATPEADVRFLKAKLDAGAGFVTTQLFFENRLYFDFVERCRAAGIDQPILPGLMPAVSLPQVRRMLALSHVSFPPALAAALEAAGGEGPVAEAVGMGWMVRQIEELFEKGAPGVHLYILNRANTALAPALIDTLAKWRG